jgi:hypothetical protein
VLFRDVDVPQALVSERGIEGNKKEMLELFDWYTRILLVVCFGEIW